MERSGAREVVHVADQESRHCAQCTAWPPISARRRAHGGAGCDSLASGPHQGRLEEGNLSLPVDDTASPHDAPW